MADKPTTEELVDKGLALQRRVAELERVVRGSKVTLEQLEAIVRLRGQSRARSENVVAYGSYCEAVMKIEEQLVDEAIALRKLTSSAGKD